MVSQDIIADRDLMSQDKKAYLSYLPTTLNPLSASLHPIYIWIHIVFPQNHIPCIA